MMKKLILVLIITLTAVSTYAQNTKENEKKLLIAGEQLGVGEYQKAIEGYNELAESGNLDAQIYLSILYSHGVIFNITGDDEINNNIPYNEELALKWLRKAVDQNSVDAQYQLGVIYNEGKLGVVKDGEKALSLFIESAKQGEPRAWYNVGNMHRQGRAGLDINYAKAIDSYMQAEAFSNGLGGHHGKALYNIGFLYYQGGFGIEKNLVIAYKYFSDAALYGDTERAVTALMALCSEAPYLSECS